jgi:hypothetical protein
MRGPLPSYRPEFPPTFLEQAEKLAWQRTVPYQVRHRAALVLLLFQQLLLSNSEAAQWVPLHPRSGRRWRHRWATGDFCLDDKPGRGSKAAFPPLDHALVKAVACELVAETKQPLSRQSLADLTARDRSVLGTPISRSTVWRILATDAIKPWRYKYWIFPRVPTSPPRPARFWTSMRACGRATPWAPRTTFSVPTRKLASKPAAAALPPCLPRQADRPTSRMNTRGGALQPGPGSPHSVDTPLPLEAPPLGGADRVGPTFGTGDAPEGRSDPHGSARALRLARAGLGRLLRMRQSPPGIGFTSKLAALDMGEMQGEHLGLETAALS